MLARARRGTDGLVLTSGRVYRVEQVALAIGWYEGMVVEEGETARRIEMLDGSALVFGRGGPRAERAGQASGSGTSSPGTVVASA